MSDLVKRLRQDAIFDRLTGGDEKNLSCQAADRIEALEAALRQAREALTAMQMEARARNCGLKICDDSIAAINDLLKD